MTDSPHLRVEVTLSCGWGGGKNGITAAVKIQADCSQVSDPGKAILEQQRNKNKSKPIGDAAGRRAGALRNELYPKP